MTTAVASQTSTKVSASKPFGVLAEFDTPQALYHACEKVRDKGFKHWDAHSPFPVHGLDRAMGLSASRLPWISLVCAILGGAGAFGLQYWIHTDAYPLIYSGKPFNSWPAFIPVTFALTVLCTAFGTVFGMFHLNRIPRYNHPVFNSVRFERFSDDKFFISIESKDAKFDRTATTELLRQAGAVNIEILED